MQIFYSKVYTRFIATIILTSFIGFFAKAQTNSPYSRYGLGDILAPQYISALGMGGANQADASFGQVNFNNPASYTGIGITTMQFGFFGESKRISTKDSIKNTGGINIANFALGMPIGKKGGLAFGLSPFSRVGYNSSGKHLIFDSTIVTNNYIGTGGTQKLFVGGAYKINNLSVGVNFQFLFGNISNASINQFYDSARVYASEYTEDYSLRGLQWQFGAQYAHLFTKGLLKNKKFKVGGTLQTGSTLNGNRDSYQSSRLYDGAAADTLLKTINAPIKVKIPLQYNFGVQLASGDHWRINADYNAAMWGNFLNNNKVDSTANTYALRMGGSYRKNLLETETYASRIEYRAGFFVGNDYIKLNNTQLSTYGISAGLGLPLKLRRNSFGTLNTSLELGNRGTTNNGLISETLTRFSIGLTLSEKWFVKRKYD